MLVRVEARHIALLRAMKVMWLPIEAGFPFVDVPEPYGSTDIAGDVARILGHSIPSPIDVHNEALRRLPIMLGAGTTPGRGLSDDQVKLLKALRGDVTLDLERALLMYCKRPYGDMTAFELDMAEILGISGKLSKPRAKALWKLHESLEDALRVWLAEAEFAPGVYRQSDDGGWAAVEPSDNDIVIAELTCRPDPSALIQAVEARNLVEAKRLLERSADPRAQDASGMTPMTFAMKNHDLAAVQLLLRAGIGIDDALGHGGPTPLILAAAYGALDIFDLLLAKGAKLSALSHSGTSALGSATLYGQEAIVRRIEASGWREPGSLGITGIGTKSKDIAVIADVIVSSTADRLGLQSGDSIVAINGIAVTTFEDVRNAMKATLYGEAVTVAWLRDGNRCEGRTAIGPKIGERIFKQKKV